MAFTRVKPADWSVNEKLTSTQMNTLDTQQANSVDKTSAGDTISGPLTLSGAGRIVRSVVTGANADTTYQPNAQRTIMVTSAVAAPVNYTLGTTGVATGDTLEIFADTTATSYVNVQNAGTTIWKVGKTGNLTVGLSSEATFIYTGSAWVLLSASRMPGMRYQIFSSTTPTTWTCPDGVYSALVTVCGGGGGGAGGQNGALSTTASYPHGGGGGGAAIPNTLMLATTPATAYSVAGGAGGTGGSAGNPGSDGSPSYFDTFYGRGGGGGGICLATGAADMSAGGTPGSTGGAPCTLTAYAPKAAGQGGFSASNTASSTLKAGSFGWQTDGAAGGGDGADYSSPAYRGGGGGGGGASGARGAGGVGANGGDADLTVGVNGSNGSDATTGTGAGGGGGGAGGSSGTTAGTGGTGGNGGSGYVLVVWS